MQTHHKKLLKNTTGQDCTKYIIQIRAALVLSSVSDISLMIQSVFNYIFEVSYPFKVDNTKHEVKIELNMWNKVIITERILWS